METARTSKNQEVQKLIDESPQKADSPLKQKQSPRKHENSKEEHEQRIKPASPEKVKRELSPGEQSRIARLQKNQLDSDI